MSTTEERISTATATTPDVQRLRKGAVGMVGVIFMAVATAAPITAMVGNVPVAVGYGNDIGAPAGYLIATVVLTVFSVGYVAMARHITATGAFYGYVSHGLGQVVGMIAGLLAALSYIVFEAALVGIFSYFAHNTVRDLLGLNVHWLVFALLMLGVNAALTYFDITLTERVLGLFLLTEIAMLSLMAVAVLVYGGGPDGLAVSALNPLNGLRPATSVAGASATLGLFMASGRGWASSRPRCTGRSPATPSGSSRAPPCSRWSGSASSTCSSRGWRSPPTACTSRSRSREGRIRASCSSRPPSGWSATGPS